MSAAKRSPEIRADSASRRQRPRHALRHTDDHVVADMHAESLVDDMQPVDVEIENDVRIGAVRSEQAGGLTLERLARHEPGAAVVLCLDDDGRALRQHFGDPRLLHVEIRRTGRIEQRQHAHDALRMMPNRAGQYLVRRRDIARDLGDVIDHDGALLQLHPRHQMMLGARQRFRRHGLAAARQGYRDIFIGHPQRCQRTPHAVKAGLQYQPKIRPRRSRRRIDWRRFPS